MKTLLIMRHATAGEKQPQQNDIDKELTLAGERQAGEAGLWLKEQQLVPDLILVSAAERTMATCRHLVEAIGQKIPVQSEMQLYNASSQDLFYLVQELPDELDTVLLLGHNPSVSIFASQVTHQDINFNQANIAVISLPLNSWIGIKSVVGKVLFFH